MDLMDYQEAADYLTIHKRTLRRYVELGLIPVQRVGPGVIRFRRADLDRYLAAQRRKRPKVHTR